MDRNELNLKIFREVVEDSNALGGALLDPYGRELYWAWLAKLQAWPMGSPIKKNVFLAYRSWYNPIKINNISLTYHMSNLRTAIDKINIQKLGAAPLKDLHVIFDLSDLGPATSQMVSFKLPETFMPYYNMVTHAVGDEDLTNGDYKKLVQILRSVVMANKKDTGVTIMLAQAIRDLPESLETMGMLSKLVKKQIADSVAYRKMDAARSKRLVDVLRSLNFPPCPKELWISPLTETEKQALDMEHVCDIYDSKEMGGLPVPIVPPEIRRVQRLIELSIQWMKDHPDMCNKEGRVVQLESLTKILMVEFHDQRSL